VKSPEERLRRFDLVVDLHFLAKALGFSGLHRDTWRWSESAPIDEVEKLRNDRLERWRYVRTEEQAR
jgi:hypothetical protein